MDNQNESLVELSKYFLNSEVREFKRSEIHPAYYNPREIDEEGRKNLRRSLKKNGVLGGIVINVRTGNTIVGGHQKVALLDEFHSYPENDYLLRAEAIDVDLATEKTINITLNNPNVGGSWDMDKMRQIIPDIDYKAAGLTDADLNMIGVDFLLQTEGENNIADGLTDLMAEADEMHRNEVEQRREQRLKERETMDEITETPEERQAKIDHMKDVKAQVQADSQEKAMNHEAYVVISFTKWEDKAAFCERFGYPADVKFIKGEVFEEQVERIE